jgi:uncharacterized membrane protein YdbT with pleckstrin-like domain
MKNQFTKYHFDGQKPDEKILLVLHRHWFDILSQFTIIFLMLVFFFGSYFLPFLFYDTLSGPLFDHLAAFFRNLFFLFIWIMFFIIWIDYYLDVWIVTDRRIVNIEQKGLFSRVVSELQLEKIQDVTTQVQGIIPTFLNYGDLFVQTAAEEERFLFHNIPDPYAVKDLVMNLQKKFETQEENEFGEMLKKKIHHESE